MKKLLSLSLLFLLIACSDSGPSPVIEPTAVYVNGNEKTNYAKVMETIPALNVGDEVDVTLQLDGNDAELKVFQVNQNKELKLKTLQYTESEVSTEPGFTDVKKGLLRFVDGIEKTHLTVKFTVNSISEEGAEIAFYLSSKAECDAAQYHIVLKTQKQ